MPRLAVPPLLKGLRFGGVFSHVVMPERRLFYIQAILIVMVGFVHIIALKLYLYWQFVWLDVFVHFFGALWIALAAVWILTALRRPVSFLRVFVVLALVSVGWELFELWGGIPREANFAFDTTIDLLSDALGGIVGYFAARRMITREASRGAEGVGEPRTVPRVGEQGSERSEAIR